MHPVISVRFLCGDVKLYPFEDMKLYPFVDMKLYPFVDSGPRMVDPMSPNGRIQVNTIYYIYIYLFSFTVNDLEERLESNCFNWTLKCTVTRTKPGFNMRMRWRERDSEELLERDREKGKRRYGDISTSFLFLSPSLFLILSLFLCLFLFPYFCLSLLLHLNR